MNLWQRWRRARTRNKPAPDSQWFLLAGFCDAAALSDPPVQDLRAIHPPADAFWADPFVWRWRERFYLFFEEFPYATRLGRISVVELDERLQPAGEAVPVLEQPWHLSYPYLFEYEGELYMLPEQKTTRRVDVYRCVEFPFRWEKAKTLISGKRLVDANLFEHEGRWWLLCAAKIAWRGLRYDETLFAFHANSPLSEKWTPHPANPLVRDFSHARPGGRIIRDGQGRLLRPSQDCARHYGEGLNLSEILELTPTRYRERLLWHKRGKDLGWHGMHHLDWHQGLLVMDAERLL
jgi:hypothetical protein